MCGEKGGIVQHPDKQLGSPPRVRGKDSLTSGYFPQGGITPACAGKSNPGIGFFLSIGGSPPRVRGKVCWSLSRGSCTWITPACAGKRKGDKISVSAGEDHPRVCGEKKVWGNSNGHVLGSPPRVRGKARTSTILHTSHGITPACAGKSYPQKGNFSGDWDHPRVCGEKKISPQLASH